jgi:5-formyltetrahydrofolate cyclo-ligase
LALSTPGLAIPGLALMPALSNDRSRLRRQLRHLRAALPRAARRAAAASQLRALARGPLLRPGSWVALYVATGSEAPTAALLALAQRRGCRICLPRITDLRAARMQLVHWRGSPLAPGPLRIRAPSGGTVVPAQRLALVIVPLLGFDAHGTRLGSGAGFYDRLLAFRIGRRGPTRVVGLAFELQRRAWLPRARHDVPLDGVLTEHGFHPC